MKKLVVTGFSLLAVVLMVLGSQTNVVGYQVVKASAQHTLKNLLNQKVITIFKFIANTQHYVSRCHIRHVYSFSSLNHSLIRSQGISRANFSLLQNIVLFILMLIICVIAWPVLIIENFIWWAFCFVLLTSGAFGYTTPANPLFTFIVCLLAFLITSLLLPLIFATEYVKSFQNPSNSTIKPGMLLKNQLNFPTYNSQTQVTQNREMIT